jgi:multimeric flavodoxin WrbA
MNKILILCGSPRKGNMHRLSGVLEKRLIAQGDIVNTILLSDSDIQYCIGCLKCEDEGICPLNDDVAAIKENILSADTIILTTPVYFDNVPGKVKSLIDRSNLFMSELKLKRFLVALCGQADEQSWNNCAEIIKNYVEICEMNYLGYESAEARQIEDLSVEKIDELASKLISRLG